MAGSFTDDFSSGKNTRIELEWTSDASGDVSGDTVKIDGTILRVVFDPDGTDAPTANYDVTLTADGLDLLAGQGANLSATVTSHVSPGVAFTDGTTTSVLPIDVNAACELVVANAGNAKKGKVIIYVR